MLKPKIVVTAATGKTGRAVALELLRRGYPVRAMVHREDARSEMLAKSGCEVVCGSMEDLVDLRDALAGAQRAYFCPPLESGALRKAVLFAAAAREAKLEAVVVLSQWLCDPLHPALHAAEKWLAGTVFDALVGTAVVTVNPGFFAENYMAALEMMAQFGVMAMPLGEGLNAPPSNEDIARVVTGALEAPDRFVGRSLRPTGPRLLSPQEIAQVFGRVLGRPVRYLEAPMRLFLKVARSLGYRDYLIAQLYWFLLDYQRDAFGLGAPTGIVEEVGASAPEDFETIARRYVAASPFVRTGFGGKLGAAWSIARALLTPAPDIEGIAARLELPQLRHATLASNSASWRASHLLEPIPFDSATRGAAAPTLRASP
jgi:NAD(P)H dehydrogenase (quinone)